MTRMAAIVSPDNEPSLRALARLGFAYERMVRMKEDEPEILYLVCTLDRGPGGIASDPAGG
jgi:RimJ/RimL family protein N-acetyltransferase